VRCVVATGITGVLQLLSELEDKVLELEKKIETLEKVNKDMALKIKLCWKEIKKLRSTST